MHALEEHSFDFFHHLHTLPAALVGISAEGLPHTCRVGWRERFGEEKAFGDYKLVVWGRGDELK